jgi:hypothetical protein
MVKKLALLLLLPGCVSTGNQASYSAPVFVCRQPYSPVLGGEPQDLNDLVRRRQELERQAKCKAQETARELE